MQLVSQLQQDACRVLDQVFDGHQELHCALAIDQAMVKCINEIGQLMGKRTVAEFVESDQILERLRELGIDYAQGYAIARPVPFRVSATACPAAA